MAIVASTHVLLAGPLLPAVPSVVRVTEPASVSGMGEVAEITVVPVAAGVMTTVLFAVAGVLAIVASTHVLLAGPLLPAVPFVVRVTEPASVSGMGEVAETTVVPVVAEVMTTVQLAVAPAPV